MQPKRPSGLKSTSLTRDLKFNFEFKESLIKSKAQIADSSPVKAPHFFRLIKPPINISQQMPLRYL